MIQLFLPPNEVVHFENVKILFIKLIDKYVICLLYKLLSNYYSTRHENTVIICINVKMTSMTYFVSIKFQCKVIAIYPTLPLPV